MDALRSGVFLLFVLLPVGSAETFSTHPHICYFLDAFLTIYCIIATGLFFKEKFSALSLTDEEPGDKACIYQELDRVKDTDAYDVLQPSKGKKKKLPRKINLSRPKVCRIKIATSLRWPQLPTSPRSETTMRSKHRLF
ncbi:CD247 antigen like isoform X1 [Pseudochaenichthys georgianus]|uniref:CD247 antigen like isoform X1 n=1 Tax=Pseudochaenichthys georgianus TaxID=52239 RepID=UPI0039C44AAD